MSSYEIPINIDQKPNKAFDQSYCVPLNSIISKSLESIYEEFAKLNKFNESLFFSDKLYQPIGDEQKKNRYSDIITTHEHGVKLKSLKNDSNSTFINATRFTNIIPNTKDYIVASAPLPNYFADWWRMIYEQDICIITMLTKLTEAEKRKADKYWPGDQITYDYEYESKTIKLTIKHLQHANTWNNSITVEVFELFDGFTRRNVVLIWNQSLPDNLAPHYDQFADYKRFMNLYNRINDKFNVNKKPVLVHCSAGIGRSAFFVSIDMIIDNISKSTNSEKYVSVFDVVKHLRKRRLSMISNENQYDFIYKFIAYYFYH